MGEPAQVLEIMRDVLIKHMDDTRVLDEYRVQRAIVIGRDSGRMLSEDDVISGRETPGGLQLLMRSGDGYTLTLNGTTNKSEDTVSDADSMREECAKRVAAIPPETLSRLEYLYRMEHDEREDGGADYTLDDYFWQTYREIVNGWKVDSPVAETTGLSLPFRMALREALESESEDTDE